MAYPWSLIACLAFLYMLFSVYLLSGHYSFLRRLYSVGAEILVGAVLLVFLIIFGLVRQDEGLGGGFLVFRDLAHSWVFVLILLCFGGICALRSADILRSPTIGNVPLALIHAGLSLVIIAALFGRGDKKQFTMNALVGQTVYEGLDGNEVPHQMPFAVRLDRFVMEEYPPRIVLSDAAVGRIPGYLELGDSTTGTLGGDALPVDVEVLRYLPSAGRDSTGFFAMDHVGTVPAALIRATIRSAGSARVSEGWVSCGSFLFPKQDLEIGEGLSLGMPRQIPKLFLSEAEFFRMGGRSVSARISVNHPLRLGSWKIYQYGYDTARGRWSTSSELLCVRDPWYPVVCAGLWLMLLSALALVATAGREDRKEVKK